jgi:integrase
MQRHPSRHGAAVIARKSKRTGTTTFSIKYADAVGVPAWERLGTDTEGWTRKKAREELDQRLVAVRTEGYRKPTGITFADVAGEWFETYPWTKRLKRSTVLGYKTILDRYLLPHLGDLPIGQLDFRVLDRYVADRLGEGLAAGTVNHHLNIVSLVVRSARKQGLLRQNPVELVDRPRSRRRRWRILDPSEVARVRTAFSALAGEEEDEDERAWIEECECIFVVVYAIGLRRGEVLGLRWRHVALADPAGPTLRVEETFVRNRSDTPKSESSERTIALGPVAAEALFEHRARTAYEGDDERVFCHPKTGRAIEPKRYAKTFRKALARAKVSGEVRPFHDGRHSAITNAARAGLAAAVLQARAGHANMTTTQRYIDLAGVRFKEEAELAEARIFGELGSTDG